MTSRHRTPSTPTPARMRRRRFLRGFGGAVVGLPFLEALSARGAGAAATPAVKRFGVFFAYRLALAALVLIGAARS